MGEIPKKYHITDNGDIYKVNDDGSFTSMGNAEQYIEVPKNNLPESNPTSPSNSKVRYSLSDMEQRLCNGKGKGLNRFERKMLVKESSNVQALEYFVEFGGTQWVNILIRRYEHGETFLEPVLLKASQNTYSSLDRLASCKRPYSSPTIYHILHSYDNQRINDLLKANPNTPYYEPNFVVPTQKSSGCFGVILLFIISFASIITTLI